MSRVGLKVQLYAVFIPIKHGIAFLIL